jgi:hypothetical protein
VSGSFERFLVERGERVVRVATTKLMADARRGARGRGKSDRIDALIRGHAIGSLAALASVEEQHSQPVLLLIVRSNSDDEADPATACPAERERRACPNRVHGGVPAVPVPLRLTEPRRTP